MRQLKSSLALCSLIALLGVGVSGNTHGSPTHPLARAGVPGSTDQTPIPTALCKDGTYSYSQHRRGTCSWHGGVWIWLNPNIPE